MRVTVTGATGMIGTKLVERLQAQGDEVTVLSRSPERARAQLGVEAHAWNPEQEPAPVAGLAGRDAVLHLAGEAIAQRWNDEVKAKILSSREVGTRNLVAGLREADSRPSALVSASGVDYYGPHGDEVVTEATAAGDNFLARVCVAWEREARAAQEHGMRVVSVRTGVVLDAEGGALKTMLPFFKLGVGGPVAGGKQYLSWIGVDDIVGIYLRALADPSWSEPVNGTAPGPVTNAEFSKALGKTLHRPAFAPIPGPAVKLLFGDMADLVINGQRAIPERTQALGYAYVHPRLEEALQVALG